MKKPEEATPNYVLKRAREQRGWTQEELAEKIGTTSVTISRWEGGVTFPNRYFRKKLSELYGQSMQELDLIQEEPNASRRKPSLIQTPSHVLSPSTLQHPAQVRPGPIFPFNEPLIGPQELYGRRWERDILISRTYRKASTSVIGPRRIGKTWLVSYLRLVASQELGSRSRIGYLDATMPSCRTVKGFATEALEALGLHVPDSAEGLISLEKGLKSMKARNRTSVLCIDEFEGFRNRQEFTLDFFRGLRAITSTYGLVLILVSRNPLSTIVGKDVETSGFFNIFEQITLEPLTVDETAIFIQEKSQQAGFTSQESECLWKYAKEGEQAWPPLRLQLVGKILLEEKYRLGGKEICWPRFEQRLEDTYRGVMY